MDKLTEQEINKALQDKAGNSNLVNLIYQKIFKKNLIRVSIFTVLVIICLVFFNQISKLSRLCNTSFGNISIFGTGLFYTFLFITFFLLIAFLITLFVLNKKIDHESYLTLKKSYSIYNISDLVFFVLSVITYLYFIVIFIITPCTIEGDSMNNTFYEGDRVIVSHIFYEPKNNDVVIFDSESEEYGNESGFWIKRIMGSYNDVLSYDKINETKGDLYVNDTKVKTIYKYQYKIILASIGVEGDYETTAIIPKDRYLLIGDNRLNSKDSTYVGLAYKKDIVGKVLLRFYPFSDFGYPKYEPLE